MSNFSIGNTQPNQLVLNTAPVAADAGAKIAALQLVPLAEFDELAGVESPARRRHTTPLTERHIRPAQRLPQRIGGRKAGKIGGLNDVVALHTACVEAVERLVKEGRSSLEHDLASRYDALERYAVLGGLRKQIVESDRPQEEKQELLADVDELVTVLMNAHKEEIEAGEMVAEQVETVLEMLESWNFDERSTRELRHMLGAKAQGVRDAMLTPLGLAKAMQEQFGPVNFTSALQALRKKFSAGMRGFKPRSLPQLWISLSDVASFTAVQNGFWVACDLKRNLSEQAGIIAPVDHAVLTVALLQLPGAADVAHILAMLGSPDKLNAGQKDKLLRLLRQAVASLPTTLWEQEMQPKRLQLLEDLRRAMIANAMKSVAVGTASQDALEDMLRQRLAGRSLSRNGDEARKDGK